MEMKSVNSVNKKSEGHDGLELNKNCLKMYFVFLDKQQGKIMNEYLTYFAVFGFVYVTILLIVFTSL